MTSHQLPPPRPISMSIRYFLMDTLLTVWAQVPTIEEGSQEQRGDQKLVVQQLWEAGDQTAAVSALSKLIKSYPTNTDIELLKSFLNQLSHQQVTTTPSPTVDATPMPIINSLVPTTGAAADSDGSTRSPISLQPITNLALICRYLTPKELLAVDKTCRLLNRAASHPLTFKQETEVGVEADLYQCRSYARGPVGIFSGDCTKLQMALTSRLFQHFRVLRFSHTHWSHGTYLSMIVCCDWLKCLTKNLTTSIRALTIQSMASRFPLTPFLDGKEIDFFRSTLSEWSQSPTMQSLTLLHLDLEAGWMILILQYLPVSVKLLHLTLINTAGLYLNLILDSILASPSATHLDQLILDQANSTMHTPITTTCKHLVALASFSHRLVQLVSLHWRFRINPQKLIADGIMELLPGLVERKILHMDTVLVEFESKYGPAVDHTMFKVFDIFRDLKRLIFLNQLPWSIITSQTATRWRSVFQSVKEIRFSSVVNEEMVQFLKAAGLTRLHTLVCDFAPTAGLSLALPKLTSLSIPRLEDIWNSQSDGGAISEALPSLVKLRFQVALCTSSTIPKLTQLLSHLPAFKHIRWSTCGWMTQSEAIKQIQLEESQLEERRRLKELRDANKEKVRKEGQARLKALTLAQDEQVKQLTLLHIQFGGASHVNQEDLSDDTCTFKIAKSATTIDNNDSSGFSFVNTPSTVSSTDTSTSNATNAPFAFKISSPSVDSSTTGGSLSQPTTANPFTLTPDSITESSIGSSPSASILDPQLQPLVFTSVKKATRGKKVRLSNNQLPSSPVLTTSYTIDSNTITSAFNFSTTVDSHQPPTTPLTSLTATSSTPTNTPPFIFSSLRPTATTTETNPFTLTFPSIPNNPFETVTNPFQPN